MSVLLVNSPFFSLRWPNLGLSLLKAGLARRGVTCDIAYWNFDLAERIGAERYTWVADDFAFVLGGERLFAKHCFGDRLPDDDRYFIDVLRNADAEFTGREFEEYRAIHGEIDGFLNAVVESVDWSRYAIVGFTTTFQQTLASVCLAQRIKQLAPDMGIVFGGAACEGSMGLELLRQFPEIDYVFPGEADQSFPEFVEAFLNDDVPNVAPASQPVTTTKKICARRAQLTTLDSNVAPVSQPVATAKKICARRAEVTELDSNVAPASQPVTTTQKMRARRAQLTTLDSILPKGVIGRETLLSAPPGECELLEACPAESIAVQELDELPYPDFDDYFERLSRSELASEIDPLFFFETSRGCWWGEKHHCAFCGLNGTNMTFRSKSPDRVCAELRHLVERYNIHRACAADNILDHRYFQTLLPALKQAQLDLQFICEVKPNVTRRQVELLVEAGLGGVQLGIETFSTPLLRQIHKGASALQNVQTLKWFTQAGLDVQWNFLYGFPGEDPAEYAALAELLPSLYHLKPPLAIGQVRADRFSPYWQTPERYEIERLRPHRAFRYVYPFPDDVLTRLAYYHEFDHANGRRPEDYARPVIALVRAWQQLDGVATLRSCDRDDGVLILHDTRPGATDFQRYFTGDERAIYLVCNRGRTLAAILEYLATVTERPPDEDRVRAVLNRWLRDRLMVFLDNHYLSLA